jgi:hypothetical protein
MPSSIGIFEGFQCTAGLVGGHVVAGTFAGQKIFDAKTAIVIFLEDVMRTASPSFAICLDVDRKHVVGS